MKLTMSQEKRVLVESLLENDSKPNHDHSKSHWKQHVFMDPTTLTCYYNDQVIRYGTLNVLIVNGTLHYDGTERHQDIMMLRYSLFN